VQQLVLVQIVDPHRAAVFLEVARRTDHPLVGLGELARAQRRIFQLADAHRHVEAFRNQLHVAVVQHHVHGDVREFLQEVPEDRRKVVHPEIGRDADPQQTRRRRLHRGHQRVGLAGIVQHPARAVVIGQTDLGRAHAAGGAVQQPRAKPGFQRGDVLGHRRLGDAHLARGVGEAPLIDDGREGLHFRQTVHGSSRFFQAPHMTVWRRNPAGMRSRPDNIAVFL
jgi:hypothetical protein